MTLEELKNVTDEEWESAANRLLYYLKSYYSCELLPEGNNLEDIVNTAIADLIQGKRKYNANIKLFTNLRWIAKSNLSKLFKCADKCKRYVLEEDDDLENMSTVDNISFPTAIDSEKFMNELEKEIEDEEDLLLILMAIRDDGATVPREIAEDTGIEVKKVYELKKKLGNRISKVKMKSLSSIQGVI